MTPARDGEAGTEGPLHVPDCKKLGAFEVVTGPLCNQRGEVAARIEDASCPACLQILAGERPRPMGAGDFEPAGEVGLRLADHRDSEHEALRARISVPTKTLPLGARGRNRVHAAAVRHRLRRRKGAVQLQHAERPAGGQAIELVHPSVEDEPGEPACAAGIWGANGSGKFALVEAFEWLRGAAVRWPPRGWPPRPRSATARPATVGVDLLHNGDVYRYTLGAEDERIVHEKLAVAGDGDEESDDVVFERTAGVELANSSGATPPPRRCWAGSTRPARCCSARTCWASRCPPR